MRFVLIVFLALTLWQCKRPAQSSGLRGENSSLPSPQSGSVASDTCETELNKLAMVHQTAITQGMQACLKAGATFDYPSHLCQCPGDKRKEFAPSRVESGLTCATAELNKNGQLLTPGGPSTDRLQVTCALKGTKYLLDLNGGQCICGDPPNSISIAASGSETCAQVFARDCGALGASQFKLERGLCVCADGKEIAPGGQAQCSGAANEAKGVATRLPSTAPATGLELELAAVDAALSGLKECLKRQNSPVQATTEGLCTCDGCQGGGLGSWACQVKPDPSCPTTTSGWRGVAAGPKACASLTGSMAQGFLWDEKLNDYSMQGCRLVGCRDQ